MFLGRVWVAEIDGLPAKLDQLRQQQVQELEERQQLWRWLLLAAAGLLILETFIGTRVPAIPQEA